MIKSPHSLVDELVSIFIYFGIFVWPSYFLLSSSAIKGVCLGLILAFFSALLNRVLQELKEINEKLG